jgi:hypothetical protein
MIALACLYLLLEGCAPAYTVAMRDGFDRQWRGYREIDGAPARAETTITVKVVIGDEIPKAGAVASYSHPQGVIHIPGKLVDGKIVICPALLGHEIQHALEYQDPGKRFMNPDL